VVGAGPGLAAARDAAYRAAAAIRMRGGWYRHDIAEAAAHGLPSPPAPQTSPAASQTSPAVRDAAGGPAASSPGS
jgi:hypothetical protein